jgi:hypothetical protein
MAHLSRRFALYIIINELRCVRFMASLAIQIRQKNTAPKKLLLEIDADQFEKLAANFGFFNPDFLHSLDRAESDFSKNRVKKIRSLKDLR